MDVAVSSPIDPPPLLFQNPPSPLTSPPLPSIVATTSSPPAAAYTTSTTASPPAVMESDPSARHESTAHAHAAPERESSPNPPNVVSVAENRANQQEEQPPVREQVILEERPPLEVTEEVIPLPPVTDTAAPIPRSEDRVLVRRTSIPIAPPPPPPPLAPPLEEILAPIPPPPTTDPVESDSEDEEIPPWAFYTEDTSAPNEEEVRLIESLGPERSALDHDHWEKLTFEELDDPEHVPGPSGRIQWTVSGINGTPEKPNRKLVMKSPSVRIGNLDWNIKFFPRGNETDYLSVYVECNTPSKESREGRESLQAVAEDQSVTETTDQDERAAAESETAVAVETTDDSSSNSGQHILKASRERNTADKETEVNLAFGQAAQIGCVLYNPNEYRVCHYGRSEHRFSDGSLDWGWTRFHGPHATIHQRRHGERQALLRNDTLCFTAYIRLVRDDTGSLWHPIEEGVWDNYTKTGTIGLSEDQIRGPEKRALISALWSWLHLAPVQNIILKAPIALDLKNAHLRPKPFLFNLRLILLDMKDSSAVPCGYTFITSLRRIIELYGVDLKSYDVVKWWEILRTIMERELEGTALEHECLELFDCLLSPSLEGSPVNISEGQEKLRIRRSTGSFQLPVEGVNSVQTALAKALGQTPERSKKLDRLPAYLQLELDRQKFDLETRRWEKLTNGVDLDDTLDLKPWTSPAMAEIETRYTLYGFIVHCGSLNSDMYSPVIRPGGIGTKWLMLDGIQNGKRVVCLTKKAATEKQRGKKHDAFTPVAYVAMYVRNDFVEEFLKGTPAQEKEDRATADRYDLFDAFMEGSCPKPSIELPVDDVPVNLRIFRSEIFHGHQGVGTLDLFDPQWESGSSEHVINVKLDSNLFIKDLREHLARMLEDVDDSRQCILWALHSHKLAPWPHSIFHRQEHHPSNIDDVVQLKDFRVKYPLCSLWLHVITKDQLQADTLPGQVAKYRFYAAPSSSIRVDQIPSEAESISETSGPVEGLSGPLAQPSVEETTLTTAESNQQENPNDESPSTAGHPVPTPDGPTLIEAEDQESRLLPAVEAGNSQERLPLSHTPTPSPPLPPAETVTENIDVPSPTYTPLVPGNPPSPPSLPAEHEMEAPINTPLSERETEENLEPHRRSPAEPPLAEEQDVRQSLEPVIPSREINECQYVFLKKFDPKTQTVVGLGTFFCSSEDNVHETIRKEAKIAADSAINVWQEVPVRFSSRVTADQTFRSVACDSPDQLFGGSMSHAPIYVFQEVLTEEESQKIGLRGEPESAPSFFQLLRTRRLYNTSNLPSYALGDAYFADTEFYTGPLVNGFPHCPSTSTDAYISSSPSISASVPGADANPVANADIQADANVDADANTQTTPQPKTQPRQSQRTYGTLINSAGDTYTGPFVCGIRHGSNGTVTFQNGDTYTGDWAHGEMSGQGRYVYAHTGNTYEGGFKNDKRHGKGTMFFEMADDEEDACPICYEAEKNAVFYDCGHVCACLDCARMVETCPVCRRRVIAAIRIWRA